MTKSPAPGGLQVVAIVGATAAGKTALGLALARALSAEIVNLDAYLVYRGMDIGTAKPTPDELAAVPHHLIDILDIEYPASVAEFQDWARTAIREVNQRGRIAVCIGGSGLYVRAVLDELDLPGTDPGLRAKYEDRLAEIGGPALHAELAAVDPLAAAAILPGNTRRVVRALEVIELTGKPFAAVLSEPQPVFRDIRIGLSVPRSELAERIRLRVAAMFDAGWLEEVARLNRAGLFQTRTASKALGYREVAAVLAGEMNRSSAETEIATATLRFAKRQLQWFKRDQRVVWLDYGNPSLLAEALVLVAAANPD